MDHSNGHKLTTFSRKGFKKLQYALVFALGTFFIAPNSFAEQIPDPFAAVRAQQSAAPAAIPTANGPSPAPAAPIVIPEAPTFNAESWVLMDYATGQVLFERDQHKRIWPASLTKMMTSYVIGMEIKAGRLDPESYVTIPESAWAALDKYSDSSKDVHRGGQEG